MRAVSLALAAVVLAGCSATDQGTPVRKETLKYRPDWIPEQVVEVKRWADNDRRVRDFQPPPHIQTGPKVTVTVSMTGVRDYATEEGSPVDVNGVTGRLIARPDPSFGEAQVDWTPEPGIWVKVTVSRLPDETETALRIARSTVRSDSPMFGSDPIRPGWLPDGVTPGPFSIEGTSPNAWTAELLARDIALRMSTGGCREPANLPQVNVRSTTGWYRHDSTIKVPRHQLFVPLDSGLCLVVSGNRSQQDLIQTADKAELAPPDTNWLGAR